MTHDSQQAGRFLWVHDEPGEPGELAAEFYSCMEPGCRKSTVSGGQAGEQESVRYDDYGLVENREGRQRLAQRRCRVHVDRSIEPPVVANRDRVRSYISHLRWKADHCRDEADRLERLLERTS